MPEKWRCWFPPAESLVASRRLGHPDACDSGGRAGRSRWSCRRGDAMNCAVPHRQDVDGGFAVKMALKHDV